MSEHAAADPVTIVVDERVCNVPADITVAAALLNLGVPAFRRSVLGESRAPLCGMGICHECRVEIDGVPDRRSCLVRVEDGLRVRTASGLRA
jgi:predicted molibdopterin-dependent oxidoreductase YjgC